MSRSLELPGRGVRSEHMFAPRFSLLTPTDGHLLAGFIEGESHLGIVENNGGSSAACVMCLAVRDDDVDLLRWALVVTGVGTVGPASVTGNSAPQASWTVRRREDCLELARVLAGFPFRGRKREELMIWRRALSLWHDKPDGWTASMLKLKRELQEARSYRAPHREQVAFESHDALAGYITGLAMAEGSFHLSRGRARFSMHLRRDDAPLLEAMARHTGLGRVYYPSPAVDANPSAMWVVYRWVDAQTLARLFLEAGFAGRKREELEIWAAALEARSDREAIDTACARLRSAREYAHAAQEQVRLTASKPAEKRVIEALQRWAGESSEVLSATAYARWRSRHAADTPTRNTVATTFGTWFDALVAAGLGSRAARGRVKMPPRPGEEIERQRVRILAGIARYEAEVGRVPTVTEFMTWRLRTNADVPSHAVFYRAFEGGWAGVLAAYSAMRSEGAGRSGV
jgi:hypothetical protein